MELFFKCKKYEWFIQFIPGKSKYPIKKLVLRTRFFTFLDLLYSRTSVARTLMARLPRLLPGRVAQSVARLTKEPEVPGSIPGPATYFRFSFR